MPCAACSRSAQAVSPAHKQPVKAAGSRHTSVCAWRAFARSAHRQTQAHRTHVGIWLAAISVAAPAKRLCCGVELHVRFESNNRFPRLREYVSEWVQFRAHKPETRLDCRGRKCAPGPLNTTSAPRPQTTQLKPRRVRGAQRAGHRTTKRRKRGAQHRAHVS